VSGTVGLAPPNRLPRNMLQTVSLTALKLPSLEAMIPLMTAILVAIQVAVPRPPSNRAPQPACVACHAPTRPKTLQDSTYLYPYRYAPGERVVVTRPRDSTPQLFPHETPGRLVPRLQRRMPPGARVPQPRTGGRPPVTLER